GHPDRRARSSRASLQARRARHHRPHGGPRRRRHLPDDVLHRLRQPGDPERRGAAVRRRRGGDRAGGRLLHRGDGADRQPALRAGLRPRIERGGRLRPHPGPRAGVAGRDGLHRARGRGG
ncbi:MAG: Xanthine/uracil/thiamine/ascorbate permease family protein, partial [uncultured Solirubrobacteraceae bacterium]